MSGRGSGDMCGSGGVAGPLWLLGSIHSVRVQAGLPLPVSLWVVTVLLH